MALRCENLHCPAQSVRLLEHFASRGALDIEGIGGIVAEKLVERGLVTTPLDLYDRSEEELAGLNLGTDESPRVFGMKHAAKAKEALERARSAPLSDWLFAFGIGRIGKTVAREIAKVHSNLSDLAQSRSAKIVNS